MLERTAPITANMEKRGGGILTLELVDLTSRMPGYYQVRAEFDTRDSMGANFINSCLEEFAAVLKEYSSNTEELSSGRLEIIMSILSNYTPDCLVRTWVEGEIGIVTAQNHINQHLQIDNIDRAVTVNVAGDDTVVTGTLVIDNQGKGLCAAG